MNHNNIPSLDEEEKSYLVFDDYVEYTFFIWLHMSWLDYFFHEILHSLINEYQKKI